MELKANLDAGKTYASTRHAEQAGRRRNKSKKPSESKEPRKKSPQAPPIKKPDDSSPASESVSLSSQAEKEPTKPGPFADATFKVLFVDMNGLFAPYAVACFQAALEKSAEPGIKALAAATEATQATSQPHHLAALLSQEHARHPAPTVYPILPQLIREANLVIPMETGSRHKLRKMFDPSDLPPSKLKTYIHTATGGEGDIELAYDIMPLIGKVLAFVIQVKSRSQPHSK